MGDPKPTSAELGSLESPPPPPPPPTSTTDSLSLVQPSNKKKHKPAKVFRVVRSVFRSFPIVTPVCKFPSLPAGVLPDSQRSSSGKRVTGTFFGYRKGRVSLSVQENPRTLPTQVLELDMQTAVLQKELSLSMVRITLECEKRAEKDKTKLVDEPLWTMYYNGKKTGYGVKREASEEDLQVMELLKATSMGAGVFPGKSVFDGAPDDELAYIRSQFDRTVGSKDSETLYMLCPDRSDGPELTIFFVRI